MRKLKIYSLPNEKIWRDKDLIMLHACFQLLKDCVEQEDVLNHCNYEVHKDFVDECRALYEWWESWLEKEKNINNFKSFSDEEEEQEMLLRLIKIRQFLWT